ncbi:MAG: flagellar motor switch phosphatase FliY [Thermovenabulum sp.]
MKGMRIMDENRMLSQDEINELIARMNAPSEIMDLSREEKDILGEFGNISIGTSATTLYTILRHKVVITTPKVMITTINKLKEIYSIPFIAVMVDYTEGLEGSNILIIKEEDAKIIADLMMGGDGRNINFELDEIRLSAVGEAMNQMMGSSATSLSTMLKKPINISPPRVKRIMLSEDSLESYFKEDEPIVRISFIMEVGELIKSEIMLLMKIEFAKSLVKELTSFTMDSTVIDEDIKKDEKTIPDMEYKGQKQSSVDKKEKIVVKPVELEEFSSEEGPYQKASIELIMDVPLEISVQLGKAVKKIKEILGLGPGSIIELDKLAGEPVDILVNGKLIAKGEVVVIDENFGVRITEILNSSERASLIQ